MNVNVFPNCGNAPKMGAVVDVTIALAGRDTEATKQLVRDDFEFSSVGSEEVIHYSTLTDELAKRPEVRTMTVSNGMSHGKAAMCEGTMEFVDDDVLHFCAVAEFANTAKDALITSLRMYAVS